MSHTNGIRANCSSLPALLLAAYAATTVSPGQCGEVILPDPTPTPIPTPVRANPLAPVDQPSAVSPVVPVVVPTRPQLPFRPPIVVPTDVESSLPSFPGNYQGPGPLSSPQALNGIRQLSPQQFPRKDGLKGPPDGIIVRKTVPTIYYKINSLTVRLTKGEILVSVKKPSKTALVETPYGPIAISANGDILVKLQKGVLRVMNLDGTGQKIKMQLDKGPFRGSKQPTVAIAPGYELVVGKKRLTRTDMRPHDGIARRHFKVLENGHLAISEFSVESAIKASDVIASMRQSVSGIKERRVLGDMSKMAAVLNYRNSTQGFSVAD